MDATPLYGGIEAGGTKFVCATGTGPDDVRAEIRFPTRGSTEALALAIEFFRTQPKLPSAIGIGAFGPVDSDPASSTYGYITNTPKEGWQNTDLVGPVRRAVGVPVVFDTDVNAAAVGEHHWGAARDVNTFLYLTVGTGIGGAAIIRGKRHHGLMHPEMGHILVPRAEGDDFEGKCPYHGQCLEGMASGPAIAARWKMAATDIPAGHIAWRIQAHYLAIAVINFIVTLSPERVILGGGVMQRSELLPMIRTIVLDRLRGYIRRDEITRHIDSYIVAPALGDRAGVLGAMALAAEAL